MKLSSVPFGGDLWFALITKGYSVKLTTRLKEGGSAGQQCFGGEHAGQRRIKSK